MLTDRYDNPISTTSQEAREAYIDGIDRFLSANEGVETAFDRAVAADPGFALAHMARARQAQMIGDRDVLKASLAQAQANTDGLSDREASHIQCMGYLLGGQLPLAYPAIRKHLETWPRDSMIAQTCVGVFGLIGFSGQPGRESEQLALTAQLLPHYGDDWFMLSGHAFSQCEVGQTGPAAETIERALDIMPRNAHGAHIKAHIHYEAGETAAGTAYMNEWRKDYSKAALLHCHISWHSALWALEQGDIDRMWSVIDADVSPGGAWGPAINVLSDMAAILYRAELAGVEVPGERWKQISDYALQSFPKPGLAFVDVHAALAHAMAGNGEALERIITDARGPAGDMVKLLAEAFKAIGAGRWAEAQALLVRTLSDHARIGGSRAQRDLIEYAMLGCLLKQGQADEARMLLAMRRPVKSDSRPVQGL